MQEALKVARWFLTRNHEEAGKCEDSFLTQMQLQKFLYYVQGYFLGCYGEPLFKENIKAWPYGPVVPPVYNKFKKFSGCGIKDFEKCDDSEFDPKELRAMKIVYDKYSKYSGIALSKMTHQEMPWMTTKKNEVITLEKLADFFEDAMMSEEEEKELAELKKTAETLDIHPFDAEEYRECM